MRTASGYRSGDVLCPHPSCDSPPSIPTGETIECPSDGKVYELHPCACGSMGSWKAGVR